jgi:hypothetical protein
MAQVRERRKHEVVGVERECGEFTPIHLAIRSSAGLGLFICALLEVDMKEKTYRGGRTGVCKLRYLSARHMEANER